jgi:hypothetical protein
MSGIAVTADVGLAIGNIGKTADEMLAMLRGAIDQPKPVYTTRAASFRGNGVTVPLLDLGSPPVGRIWNLRSISVFGADAFTVPSGSTEFAVYFGDIAGVSFAQLKMCNKAIPQTVTSSSDAYWCHANENIIVQTNGAPANGVNLTATAEIVEWRTADIYTRSGKP